MMPDLAFYWKIFLRRLPAMMAIFILCSAVGAVLALRAPVTFEAEARLLIEEPQIPGGLAAATVNLDPNQTIEIIRQRLLTRANLLDIANDLDVFERLPDSSPDTVVNNMRQATGIDSRGGRGQPVVVTVSFSARTGQIAANVVNDYVTRIINANVELRTGRAEDTMQFFEQEVERLSVELDLQGAQINQFQIQNADALPSEQDFRLNRQSLLQERIATAERERVALIDQRNRLMDIFDSTGRVSAPSAPVLTAEQQQLAQLQAELSQARTIFSETSPQVQGLVRRIEILREQVAATAGGDSAPEDEGTPVEAISEAEAILNLQLSQIDTQVASLEELITTAGTELLELEDAIARTPLNAITLSSLQRDYDNIRAQYDNAIARLAEASTGERIELTARGQRISIIESASVPRTPANGDRTQIAIMGAAAGIGLAVGLFLLLELLNRSVRRPAEIQNALGIQPLATIPFIETQARRLWRRLFRLASYAVVVVGIPAILWGVDTYYMPLDQLADRVFDRIRNL